MKKVFLAICIATVSSISYGQKGNNQIGVGADVGFPISDFGDRAQVGFGGYVKGLFGIGEAGQITLTSGYTTYSAKTIVKTGLGADKVSYSIIPVLAGYRHNFDGFYAEPQVGYGSYGSKVKGGIFDGSSSGGAFTWAVGFGFAKNGFDIGARYQSGHDDGTTIAVAAVRVGYNFSLSGGASGK
jgi:hypothetical protein